jgi:hypothetical protein
MAPIYFAASAAIFAHIVLFGFLWYICTKNIYKRDMQQLKKDMQRSPNRQLTFHQKRKRKVYKYAEQNPNNEQLYGYWVHCEIGSILISNN